MGARWHSASIPGGRPGGEDEHDFEDSDDESSSQVDSGMWETIGVGDQEMFSDMMDAPPGENRPQ